MQSVRPAVPDGHQLLVSFPCYKRHGLIAQDLSAAVDVYSDWIDACDAVAKDDGDGRADDGLNSYEELAAGNERRNSEMNIDRHLVSAVGGNDYGADDFVDDD